jgi:regulator of replication initiation timing
MISSMGFITARTVRFLLMPPKISIAERKCPLSNPNQKPQTPKNLRLHLQQNPTKTDYPCAPRLSKTQKQPSAFPSQSTHNLTQKFHSAYQSYQTPRPAPYHHPSTTYHPLPSPSTPSPLTLKTILTVGLPKSTRSLSPNQPISTSSITGPSYYFAPNKTMENLRPTTTTTQGTRQTLTPTPLKYARSLSPNLQLLGNEGFLGENHFFIKSEADWGIGGGYG